MDHTSITELIESIEMSEAAEAAAPADEVADLLARLLDPDREAQA